MKEKLLKFYDFLEWRLLVKLIIIFILCFFLVYISQLKIYKVTMFCSFILFTSLVFAWIVNPIVDMLAKKIYRVLASIIIVLGLPTIFVAVLCFTIPGLVKQLNSFFSTIPILVDQADGFVSSFTKSLHIQNEFSLSSLIPTDSFTIDSSMAIFDKAVEMISFIVLVLTLTIYILVDYSHIKQLIKKICNVEFIKFFREVDVKVRAYIKGMIIVTIYLTAVATIIFWIAGLKEAVLAGIFVGVLDIIPYVGPVIASVPILLFSFLSSFSLFLKVLVAILVIQVIEGSIIQPFILSKQTRMNPILILISLVFFGSLFGVVGMLIATPMTLVITIALKHIWKKV